MPSFNSPLAFHPLTPERWADFEDLFGANGACAGCWCMWWRKTRAAWQQSAYADNHAAMRALVHGGNVPGILAYVDGAAAGWCSLGPRSEFPALDRSRNLKPVDDRPVWSIVCFFIRRGYRRKGLMTALLGAAIDYARSQGAATLEAYPVDRVGKVETLSDFTGVASSFRKAGFVEVARRAPTRPIMRCELQ